MKRSTFLFFILLVPFTAFSEPYLAIREGLKCSACHINRTGGGERTRMGSGYGAQQLPWKTVDLQANKIPYFWSFLDDLISVGGDFRFANRTNFVKDQTANTFLTEKANLYGNVRFLPDVLSFYVDETVAPGGAQARELLGIFEKMPAHGWIKAGKMVLPYGIRLEDDRAFIREVTGFNFNTPDEGVEVGFEPGNWSIQASLTNGTPGSLDNNASKQIVGNVAYVTDLFRVGASGAYNPGDGSSRTNGGVWGGLRLGKRAVVLGEIDQVRDELDTGPRRDQFVAHAEVDYLIADGWNVKAAYEYYDPDQDIDENQRDRVVVGIEPFLLPFLQMGIFYRFNQSIPQNAAQNADELNFRFHIYF
jgi:hypothetical protein